jgi:high affinity Mn2+ porin
MVGKNGTFIIAATLCIVGASVGQAFGQSSDTLTKSNLWRIHFQLTLVDQYHPAFPAQYSGLNSLSSGSEEALSLTTTLFAGVRLWGWGQAYFDPEVSGGSGFSKVQGIAGFPNNEVVRVGTVSPALYPARLFIQGTVNLGEATEAIEDDVNQLACKVSPQRVVFRFGKFSVLDYFDDNCYAHDGRAQFMNWALVSNGSWDYPADTRGYDIGFMTEYLNPAFAVRVMAGMVPTTPNGATFDRKISANHGLTAEVEKTYALLGKDGKARLLLFYNQERSARYQDEINNNDLNLTSGENSDSLGLRRDGTAKYGAGINLEQKLSNSIGCFLRAGWNDGQTETWMFTEIDRSLSFGSTAKGGCWKRANDEAGLAFCFNGLSDEHRSFLARGGYGFIIGDGKLIHYGTEDILEAYYSFNLISCIFATADYQFIANPAYNKDRGPVNVFSARVHVEI